MYGPDGNIYGVGNQQGNGLGTGFIYRFTPTGAYSQLLTFPSFPVGHYLTPIMAASDGHLYGLFGAGGVSNNGEIYQASLSGQLQVVASFPAKGMGKPQTLMQAADGNIYGTTEDQQIFRYDPARSLARRTVRCSSGQSPLVEAPNTAY